MTGRYEKRDLLGEGGMGFVFRAFDRDLKREVAIKTIRDAQDRAVLDLFRKECAVLASLHHPNIVDIYDIGETDEDGARKPYFVMPLLPGAPLSKLIQTQPHRLTPERTVEIMSQVCRGLQAAHERGLVHRDLKPSNIFVLDDDSVKIIDFGVAHLVDHRSSIGVKGTLFYMAPEQLDMQPASAMTDIFSLGVVCFEMLTRRRPFTGTTRDELVEAIRKHIPPPVSELNPAVNTLLSQVIHASMAKQPWHRFSSAREFSDCLVKAVHNQPIDRFDRTKIEPRLANVRQALEDSQYDFAHDILTELEAEGHIHPEMRSLREQVDRAVRGKQLQQLVESAKTRLDRGEFQLALEKVQQALMIDPVHLEAQELKNIIQEKKSAQQVQNWIKLGQQHLDNFSFAQARQAVQNVLQINATETTAIRLLGEIDRREQEYATLQKEKEKEYSAALENWRKGEVSAALSRLERVMEMDRKAPGSEHGADYQSLYNQVREKQQALKNALEEVRAALERGELDRADKVCDQFLLEYPDQAQLKNLKFDIEERRRQELSAYIARMDSEVNAEPDLDKRVLLLEEALAKYPEESHFQRALQSVRQRRDHINSIVSKARNLEERGQYADAKAQWETLRTVYSQYPGLDFELDRLRKREEQQSKLDKKARTVAEIDRALRSGDYALALHQVQLALQDFPDAPDLPPLEKLAKDGLERAARAAKLVEEGRELCGGGRFDDGLKLLQEALNLEPQNPMISANLVQVLVQEAAKLVDTDWRKAEQHVRYALELDGTNQQAKSVRAMVADRKRGEAVEKTLSEARRLQSEGNLAGALAVLEEGLSNYPGEPQLVQVAEILREQHDASARQSERMQDLRRMEQIEQEIGVASDPGKRRNLLEETSFLAQKYPEDPSVQAAFEEMRRQWQMAAAHTPKPTEPATPAPASPAAPAAPPPAEAPVNLTASGLTTKPKQAEPPAAPVVAPAAAPAVAAQAAPPAAPPVPPVQKPAAGTPPSGGAGKPGGKRNTLAFAGAALGFLVVLFGVYQIIGKRDGKQAERGGGAGSQVTFELQTNPPGAKIRVDGLDKGVSPMSLTLTEGAREVEALMEGFLPLKQQIFVQGGMTPVSLNLTPAGQMLKVSLKAGKVTLDGQELALTDGTATRLLTNGDHVLEIADDATGRMTLNFKVSENAPPVLNERPKITSLLATIASSQGDKATVYWPGRVVVNGQPQQVPPEGLVLTGLPSPGYELSVVDSTTRSVMLETGPARLLQVVITDYNMGGIVISSNAEGANVLINGRPARSKLSGGRWVGYYPVGTYSVKLEAEGFSDEPAQDVEVKKGEQTRITLNLRSTPKLASIEMTGITENAEVFLDNTKIGTTNAQGALKADGLPPGAHKLIIRKEGFDDYVLPVNLNPGGQAFSGMKLKAMGRVDVAKSPATAAIRYRPESGGEFRALPGLTIQLRAGRYVFEGSVPGAPPQTKTVEVRSETTTQVNFAFTETKSTPTKQASSTLTTDALIGRDQQGWKILTGPTIFDPGTGPVKFVFKRQGALGGMKKVGWYLNYRGERDHWRCDLGQNELECKAFENGKENKSLSKKWDLRLGREEEQTVEIEIRPGSAVHRLSVGTFTLEDSGMGGGRFGFRGDAWIKDFEYRRQ